MSGRIVNDRLRPDFEALDSMPYTACLQCGKGLHGGERRTGLHEGCVAKYHVRTSGHVESWEDGGVQKECEAELRKRIDGARARTTNERNDQ